MQKMFFFFFNDKNCFHVGIRRLVMRKIYKTNNTFIQQLHYNTKPQASNTQLHPYQFVNTDVEIISTKRHTIRVLLRYTSMIFV